MDVKLLTTTVVVLLALSALGGIVMGLIRLAGRRNPPAWLAMGHGLLAAAALTLLLYGVFTLPMPRAAAWAALALVGAAIGGVTLNLGFDQKQRLIPRRLMTAHAVLAIAGVALLLLAWTGMSEQAIPT